ncbi:hypothetical protein TNIN_363171, partial [Trichonephila inaurata madagascariensis]
MRSRFQVPTLFRQSDVVVVKLIPRRAQKQCMASLSILLARLREKFWIVRAKRLGGVPRVARIRTSHGERIRLFQRLYPLEVSAKTIISVLKVSGKDSLPVEETPESSTDHVSDTPTDYVPDSPVESTDNSEEKPPNKTRLGRTIKIPRKLD